MADLLDDAARQADLPPLGETGWGAVSGRDAIRKIWKFKSFSEAWAFMSRAALAAEALNHHPEWSNKYNIVDVTLSRSEDEAALLARHKGDPHVLPTPDMPKTVTDLRGRLRKSLPDLKRIRRL